MSTLRKGKRLALATMAAAALAGSAYAGEWPSFEEVDRNGDGVVDAEETLSLRGFNFKIADKDKDGKVSQAEYQSAKQKQGAKGKKGS